MRSMKRVVYITAMVVFLAAHTLTAAFFEIETGGARSAGMSGAYSGMTDEPDVVFYNPATLGLLRTSGVALLHQIMPFGMSQEIGSYVWQTSFGNLGVGIVFWNNFFESEENRLVYTGGTPTDMLNIEVTAIASYGLKILDFLSVGGSLKYLSTSIMDYSANAFALDLGATVSFKFLSHKDEARPYDFTGNLVLRNVGLGAKFVDSAGSTASDLTIVLNASQYVPFLRSTIAGEIEFYTARQNQTIPLAIRVGVESLDDFMITPRFGVSYNGNTFKFSLGASFSFDLYQLRYSVDYAYVTSPDDIAYAPFGSHMFGVTIKERPAALYNIVSEYLNFPKAFIAIDDKYEGKADDLVSRIQQDEKGTYVVEIKEFTGNHIVEDKAGFLTTLRDMIKEKLAEDPRIVVYEEGSGKTVDAYLKGRVEVEGELLSFFLTYYAPRDDRELMRNSFTEAVDFEREEKDFNVYKAFSTGKGVRFIIDPSSIVDDNSDFEYLESLSEKTREWVASSIVNVLSGRVIIRSTEADATVFLDGKEVGVIGESKTLTFSAMKGERYIAVIKPGFPGFVTQPPRLIEPQKEYTIDVTFDRMAFETTVTFTSFPSNRPFSLDEASFVDATDTEITNVKSGRHTYYIKDGRGKPRERHFGISEDLIYHIHEVFSWNDTFDTINRDFWKVVSSDRKVTVVATNGALHFFGKTTDDIVKGNGVVTPLFPVNDTITLDISYMFDEESKGALYFGLLDESDNGYLVRCEKEQISKQLFGDGNVLDKVISALKVEDTGLDVHVSVAYDFRDGIVTVFANDVKVYEEEFVLVGNVRFVLFADGNRVETPIDVRVSRLAIENF